MGRETESMRQIDISIRSKIAGYKVLIIVQAKKLKKPADINIVGEFEAVIRDVQASRGILICHSGFTKKAKIYVANKKIDICTAHDASIEYWQTKIEVPVIKKTITVDVKINHTYIPMGNIFTDRLQMPFPEDSFNSFLDAWNNNSIPKSPGVHFYEYLPDGLDYNKDILTLESRIEYIINHRYHFKFFVPKDYRGLKDYITSKFNPSFMAFEENIPYLNDGTWKYVSDPSEVSVNTKYLNIEIIDIGFLKEKSIKIVWEEIDEED